MYVNVSPPFLVSSPAFAAVAPNNSRPYRIEVSANLLHTGGEKTVCVCVPPARTDTGTSCAVANRRYNRIVLAVLPENRGPKVSPPPELILLLEQVLLQQRLVFANI